MKVLSVFGTRPEAIKMAPLLQALDREPNIESVIAVTAQHREMLDQVLQLFDIHPDYDLNLMRHGQTLEDITSAVLKGLYPILEDEKPELVLFHGDTTTTMATALAAYYHGIPCGHVEAGLRSGDKYAPFPEEVNRRIATLLADYNFAPTELAANNLRKENVAESSIHITGNTVIDALLQAVDKPCSLTGLGLDDVDWSKKIILLTCHRRENWGGPMKQIFAAINDVLTDHPEAEVVFPVHKNPLVREIAKEKLGNNKRVHFCEPLDYLPFCHVMKQSYLLVTDSGGMQEEGPSLGKPVLVLREVTERPEAVEAGTAMLIGNNYDNVHKGVDLLLSNKAFYDRMAQANNPYGDGRAALRIASIISDIAENK